MRLLTIVLTLILVPTSVQAKTECEKIEDVYKKLLQGCRDRRLVPESEQTKCIDKIDKLHDEYVAKGKCKRPSVS